VNKATEAISLIEATLHDTLSPRGCFAIEMKSRVSFQAQPSECHSERSEESLVLPWSLSCMGWRGLQPSSLKNSPRFELDF
jgi:hypothetical protein